jgi:PPOX class probable F420-dependent enzyme
LKLHLNKGKLLMPAPIPDSHRDLLEKPIVVTLVTITPQNKPHAVAVWQQFDGEFIRISIDYGTVKHKNVLSNPQVAVMALDPANPYRYITVNGTAEVVEEGALELLDILARSYMNYPQYFGYNEPIERKETYRGVVLKITPERVIKVG